MLPRASRHPARPRPRLAAAMVGVLVGVTAGCGVLELGEAAHDAVVLEGAAPTDDERWSMVVELLQTDIAGEAVVAVAFEGDEVPCVDGGALAAAELLPATELRFEQGADGVEPADEDEPPLVSGVELEVHCD